MTAVRRPVRRWRAAPALVVAAAAVAAVLGAAPTAAQEAPSTTTTTTAPPTTAPGSGTTVPGDATTTTAPGATASAPATSATTTTTTTPPTTAVAPATPSTAPEAPAAIPQAAADAPTVTLDVPPGTLLVDGQEVAVTVTGLPVGYWVSVQQCAPGPEPEWERCPYDGGGYVELEDGTVQVRARLDAVLDIGGFESAPRSVDCRVQPCTLLVEYGGEDRAAVELDLSFDPDAPLAPPPSATVTPAGPYAHGQAVTVSAEGLVWSSTGRVLQCPTGATAADQCDRGSGAYLDLGAGTAGATVLTLYAVLDTSAGPVDCRVAGACVVAVAAAGGGYGALSPAKTAIVPVAFDPATEVEPPTLAVQPASGLVHGQLVTVTGSGFVPELVQLSQCTSDLDPASCRWLDGWGEPDGSGAFTAQARVSAVLTTPDGEVDCRTAPAPCVIVASASSPDSPRAGVADLVFDPDGPVPPPPTITVSPSTGLRDETAVEVTGRGFGLLGDTWAEVDVCRTGTPVCDEAAGTWIEPSADGRFTTTVVVAARFTTWDGTEVDCRTAPGCEVTARDGDGRAARAALSFGPPATPADRYLLPVFDEVETTAGIVYRRTVDAAGDPVELTLDVVRPAGDTETDRPVVVWLSGGWFGPTAPELTGYAEDFARRGYVSVTMRYRSRPGLRCCPTDDVEGVTAAVDDATQDAAAGVAWLRDHAGELGIDPDLVVVGGSEGGATAAYGLAHVARAPVAAAVPIAGVDFGSPDAGEPPFLAFHDPYDDVAPAHLSQAACARASARGTACDTVVLTGLFGDLASTGRRAIVARTSEFLVDVVLTPSGVVDPVDPPGGDAGAGGVGAAPVAVAIGTFVAGGWLPVTGVEVAHQAALALGLVLVGGAALAARRAGGRRPADAGAARVGSMAAVAALGLALAAVGIASALGPGGEAADDRPVGDRGAEVDHGAMGHGDDASDHAASGHEASDHGATDHGRAFGGHAVTAHDAAAGAGHGHTGATGSGGHEQAHGAADGAGGHVAGGHAAVPGHPAGTPGGHPGGPHQPHDPHDPPHEPPTGFDPAWTPDQVAFANQLIADTQAQLRRYDTLAVLPLTGYQWIRDGQQRVGAYQHWIHLGRISDPRRLDAAYPESLVLRNTAHGPVLEAAMYMLSPGYTLATVPADIAWLPGWHVHDNLCFENGFELVGVTVNGRCERGSVIVTPPMIHVWREPTRCGWFAGVDEFGLQCHEH